MLRSSTVDRVLGTTSRILHDEGVSGLSLAVREWAAVRAKYVNLGGCTFNLKKISDTGMKIALIRKEYEGFERRAVLQYTRPECPVIELGGCIGVVACITNRALKGGRSHVVVEANPLVIPLLQENRDLNHCDFEILNAAIAYDQPSVTFYPSLAFPSNSLRYDREADPVTVNTSSLGKIVSQRQINSFTLICDIEGHEYELVQHEADVLKRAETIILETHARMIGETKNSELLGKLEEIGFEKIDEEATVVVLRRSA